MSIANNLKAVTGNLQQGARNMSISLLQRMLRALTGFFVGIVLALIVQEFTQSGLLILTFFTILFAAIIYRLLRNLSVWQILVFDGFCLLLANTLRMYILLAP